MYYHYFGLQEAPFSIAVDPQYLFMSEHHRDALAHLLYGVGAGGGFVLLTGEVGTGKTTIIRCLLKQLPDNTDLAMILNPALNAQELLATVCDELRISYPPDTSSLKLLSDCLHQYLLDNYRRGRNTVLLIDEAQHLQFDVLEQIRLLTNLETDSRKLLQIILVGQPELQQMLARPELRQLAQRITARYQLRALNLSETRAYIQHRLQVAGMQGQQRVFSHAITRALYRASAGIPRRINLLCDRLLLGCYGRAQPRASLALLRQAKREVMGELEMPRRSWVWALAALLALMIGAGAWYGRAALPPVVAAAPAEPVNTLFAGYAQREQAVAALVQALGWQHDTSPRPCADGLPWRCEQRESGDWQQLLETNRPAVLELLSPQRFTRYIALLAIDGERALVLGDQGPQTLDLAALGSAWSGGYSFVWHPPEGFDSAIGLGDRGALVGWLSQQFARLDEAPRGLATDEFNEALAQRVRYFQRQFQLRDDGVVGLRTLLKLNEQLARDVTLDRGPWWQSLRRQNRPEES